MLLELRLPPGWEESHDGKASLLFPREEAASSGSSSSAGWAAGHRPYALLQDSGIGEGGSDIVYVLDTPAGRGLTPAGGGTVVLRRVGPRVEVHHDGVATVHATHSLPGFGGGGVLLAVGHWGKDHDRAIAAGPLRVNRVLLRRLPAPPAAADDPHSLTRLPLPPREHAPAPADSLALANTPEAPEAPEAPPPPQAGEPAAAAPDDAALLAAVTKPLTDTAALVRDAWLASFESAGSADRPWADDARRLIEAEALLLAADLHERLPLPTDAPTTADAAARARALLDAGCSEDVLVFALAHGRLAPCPTTDAPSSGAACGKSPARRTPRWRSGCCRCGPSPTAATPASSTTPTTRRPATRPRSGPSWPPP